MRRYIGDNASLHAAAMFKAIGQVNLSKITRKGNIDELFEHVSEIHKIVNDDYSFTRRIMRETPAQKTKAYELVANKDFNEIRRFMEKWNPAGNEEVAMELVKLLIKPRPVSGAFSEIDNFNLPYVYMNNKVFAATLQYLKENKNHSFITIEADGAIEMPKELRRIIEYQRDYVKKLQNFVVDDVHLERLEGARRVAIDTKKKAFGKFGEEHRELIEYLMDDYGWFDPGALLPFRADYQEGPIHTVTAVANRKGGSSKKVIVKRINKLKKRSGCKK